LVGRNYDYWQTSIVVPISNTLVYLVKFGFIAPNGQGSEHFPKELIKFVICDLMDA